MPSATSVKPKKENTPTDTFWKEDMAYDALPPLDSPLGGLSMHWIMERSRLPWLKIPLKFPAAEMLEEARRVLDRFVSHRGNAHPGWNSLCVHGLSAEQTLSPMRYGFKNDRSAPYVWTEIADECPVTRDYFENEFPWARLFRVRYMLLEPGGCISPHTDRDYHRLTGLNLALNQPDGCQFKMRHGGIIPIEAGDAFFLDIANEHSVINLDDEPRIHMIVHAMDHTAELEQKVIAAYRQHTSRYPPPDLDCSGTGHFLTV
jgi:hypothetical protein